MLSYCIAALILLIDVNWGEPTVLVDVYFSDGVEGEEKKFKRKAYQMIGAYGFLFGLQYVCYFFCHRVLKGKVEKALDEVTEHIDRSLQAQADTGARNDSNNSDSLLPLPSTERAAGGQPAAPELRICVSDHHESARPESSLSSGTSSEAPQPQQ